MRCCSTFAWAADRDRPARDRKRIELGVPAVGCLPGYGVTCSSVTTFRWPNGAPGACHFGPPDVTMTSGRRQQGPGAPPAWFWAAPFDVPTPRLADWQVGLLDFPVELSIEMAACPRTGKLAPISTMCRDDHVRLSANSEIPQLLAGPNRFSALRHCQAGSQRRSA